MTQKSLFTRRTILRLGLLSVPLLAATRNFFAPPKSSEKFTSEYIINISSMNFIRGASTEQMMTAIMQKLVELKAIDRDWLTRYSSVHSKYLRQSLILSSQRTLREDSGLLSFTTLWRDQQSFLSFFKDAEFYTLDNAYISHGFAPNMTDSHAVFPSHDAYLLLQNKKNLG